MEISRNCAAAKNKPNREHICTGCDCPCHHVAAPPDFRALVEALKEEDQS